MRKISHTIFILLVMTAIASAHATSQAKDHTDLRVIPDVLRTPVEAPDIDATAWLLVHHETGFVLTGNQANERISPASMTKIMTSFLVFEALKNQKVNLEDVVSISEKAWRMKGTRMFLDVGSEVKISDLLSGLIIQSGNDAAVALAEHLSGTEEAFANQMNVAAKRLGMNNTRFENSSGWPSAGHYSTVQDLATLVSALISRFPEYYQYYREKSFTYNGISQQNKNMLLASSDTVDGVKTGYTADGGYSLIGSAQQDGMRMTAVVTGASSKTERARMVDALLKYGFNNYETFIVHAAKDELGKVKLWYGESDFISVGVEKPVQLFIPQNLRQEIKTKLKLPLSLDAPIKEGQEVGEIMVTFNEELIFQDSVVAVDDYIKEPFYKQIITYFRKLIGQNE